MAITGAMIGMAKKLNRHIVAEGVETYEQLEILLRQGCGEIQGFYFSEALAADEFEKTILRGGKVKSWIGAQACL